MRSMVSWTALVIVLAAAGSREPFLSGSEAARLLADGKPWAGTRSESDPVQLTFNPDGTGRFEGPVTRSTTWEVRADTICIHIGFPLGSKCLRFRRQGAALQGFDGDTPDMTLTR